MPSLTDTIADFDAQNARDPRLVTIGAEQRPRELVDAERLAAWISRLVPDASIPLQLAAHCQHLRRWESPRETFPDGRKGYLAWRTALYHRHATLAAETLNRHGWDPETIAAVTQIVSKQPGPDSQHMEDALCLSFLEHDADAFAAKHDPVKVERILAKTLRKMSEHARAVALTLK